MRLGARVVVMMFLVLSLVPTAWTRPLAMPAKSLWPQFLLEATAAGSRHHDEVAGRFHPGIAPNEDNDPQGCHCVAWEWSCIPNCVPECQLRVELVCTPEGCTEQTTCDIVYRCTYDCVAICLADTCYI